MLYICTKFCQSISKGFRVIDLNARIDPRVVANLEGGTDVPRSLSKMAPSFILFNEL